MAKLIITSGCSFTAGVELEDYKDNWEKGLEESRLVWSYKIKEKLWPDAEFLNVSKSGGSNATITKKTIYYTSKMLEKYDPKDIVVLVMWTGVDRREWRLTNKNELDYEMSDFKYENTTAGDPTILLKKDLKSVLQDYYHPVWTNFRKKTLVENKLDTVILNYYKNFVNKESSLYDALKNIEYLSLFLEKNNIPYYYTSSDSHIFEYSNDVLGRDMFIDRLIKSVNPNENFFSIDNAGFIDFTIKNNLPLCEFGHSGKEAHQEYANLMTKWIEEHKMNKKQPLYCYQAMQGVSITSDGKARPCCVVVPKLDCYTYTTRYDDKKHKNLAPPHRAYNVAETFHDFVNADFLKDVRKQLRNGEWPDICKSCKMMEESGLKSYRQSHNEMNQQNIDYNFENMDQDGGVSEKAIEYLDITLGNQCNLKCRSCNPYLSHSWVEESKEVEFVETQWKWFDFDHINRVSDDPWYKYSFENDYFKNTLPNLKGINFIGGEPLVVKEHYDWLEKIVESGYAKNIHLTYNTNGTTIPDTLLDLWENFKSINIGLSVDAYGDLAHYVRFPSKWKNIERNSQKLADYAQNRGTLTVHLHTTISLLNIHALPDLLEWSMHNFKKRNFYSSELGYNIGFQKLVPSFNIVSDPTYLNVCHLPDEEKEKVNAMLDQQYDYYMNTDLVPDWAKNPVVDILNLKNYVNQPRDEKQWQAFLTNTKRSDAFRKVNIIDYIPWMEKYL